MNPDTLYDVDASLIKKLERIDWNFPGSKTQEGSIHSLHWYPGNFIPQIPSFLIELLSIPGDLVVDPFCGSGTTGIEAILLNRRAYLSDSSRSGIALAKAKAAILTSPTALPEIKTLLDELLLDFLPHSIAQKKDVNQELVAWLHPAVLTQLIYLWSLISSCSRETQDILTMLFTDILFACSATTGALTSTGQKRRHHWGWVADNVKPKSLTRHDVVSLFRHRLIHLISLLSITNTHSNAELTVERKDARQIDLKDNSVDLVVTSPPYLGMIDYVFANRLTYLWMNWPMEEDKKAEIGSRRDRTRRNVVLEYTEDMKRSFAEICRVLKPGKYCAVVIGTSRKFPAALEHVMSMIPEGLILQWGPHPRVPSRRRVSERKGSEPTEYIYIYRKCL